MEDDDLDMLRRAAKQFSNQVTRKIANELISEYLCVRQDNKKLRRKLTFIHACLEFKLRSLRSKAKAA